MSLGNRTKKIMEGKLEVCFIQGSSKFFAFNLSMDVVVTVALSTHVTYYLNLILHPFSLSFSFPGCLSYDL